MVSYMAEITIKKPDKDELKNMGVENWPTWEKGVSEFPWEYSEQETCYFHEGEVTVTTEDGKEVKIKAGDLAIFPKGLKCVWKVEKPVRKVFKFG